MDRKYFPRPNRPNWPLPPYAVFRCRPAKPWIIPDGLVLETDSFDIEQLHGSSNNNNGNISPILEHEPDDLLSESESTFQFKPRQRAIRRKSSAMSMASKGKSFIHVHKDKLDELKNV